MDVRAYLAEQGLHFGADQYVKTGSLVSPELIQYLETRYPDKLSNIDMSTATIQDIAFEAGCVEVIKHLKVLMEAAQLDRSKRVLATLPQVD